MKSLRSRVLGQTALKPLAELTEAALNARFPKGAVIRLKGLLSEVPDGLTPESDCLHLADRILTMIQQECEQPTQRNPSTPSARRQAAHHLMTLRRIKLSGVNYPGRF